MMRGSRPRSARRAWLPGTREKWSEKRSACTRRGGASNTRNARTAGPRSRRIQSRLRAAFLFEAFLRAKAMIKAGVVGGTGYSGVELLRLLAQHPQVEIAVATSRQEAGKAVSEAYPSLRGRVGLAFTKPDDPALKKCNVVFFCTP